MLDIASSRREARARADRSYSYLGEGVLLQMARAGRRRCLCRWELRGDAEDGMDKLALRDSVALSNPAHLTFADGMHCLVALNRSTGAVDRSKSQARGNPLLDEAMVLPMMLFK